MSKPMSSTPPLLEINDLQMHYPISSGIVKKSSGVVKAVDGVSFTIREGETLGLVGESGCGKTTTGRAILRAVNPTGGSIDYRRPDGKIVDLVTLSNRQLKEYRREIRMVFQDPYSSLNPRMTVLDIVSEPLRVNSGAGQGNRGSRRRVIAAGRFATGIHASLSSCIQRWGATAYFDRPGAGVESEAGGAG